MTTIEYNALFSSPGHDIVVTGLRKSYRSGEEIYHGLQGVSCVMPRGKVTIIQGPSGCGKSTLLNMLGGVDRPDGGRVIVDERDLTAIRAESELADYRLNQVGFIFQAYNLIASLNATENLQLPMTVAGVHRSEQRERAHALLGLVDMAGKATKRPDALSGGEQQRVALALALANDPPIVLADEPTGNLDTLNARRVVDLLCVLARDFGKTVVVTTHDPVVAERADQLLLMRDAKFQTN